MEKKMENDMDIGIIKGLYRDPSIQNIPIMENQMEKKMENEMEIVVIKGLHRDPSIQIISTLGPKVYKYYLHWAFWIPRAKVARENREKNL